ncbi:hypothetical protein D3C78_1106000 [compost metagenome]
MYTRSLIVLIAVKVVMATNIDAMRIDNPSIMRARLSRAAAAVKKLMSIVEKIGRTIATADVIIARGSAASARFQVL